MAHSHHAGHAGDSMMGMDNMDMMTMTMYFYQSNSVKFLFKEYDVSSTSGYFSVILVSFVIGFATETLAIVQDKLDQQITSKIRER